MKISNQFSDLKDGQILLLIAALEQFKSSQESRDDVLTRNEMTELNHILNQLNTLYWYRIVPADD